MNLVGKDLYARFRTRPSMMDLASGPGAVVKLAPGQEQEGKRLSLRVRNLLLTLIWIVALVPFLFLRSEWFGRPLSDQQIGEYLHSNEKPKQIESALVQISDRMARHDSSVKIWYSDLLRLAKDPMDEVRALDARALGQDPTQRDFHAALREMLEDHSQLVRLRAALSLLNFGDASGHDEIVASLRPMLLQSPAQGRVTEIARPGSAVRQGTVVARINTGSESREMLSTAEGQVRIAMVSVGSVVAPGAQLIVLQPGPDIVSQALRALGAIGTTEDIPVIAEYQGPAMPERIRQQAVVTEQNIRLRSARK